MQNRAQVAAVVGAVVLAYVIIEQVVSVFGYLNGVPAGQLPSMLLSTGGLLLTYYLPFAVGVFAGLWLLAPITAALPLSGVVKRSLLAAGIGAAVIIIVGTVVNSAGAFSGVGSFMGNSFPELPVDRVVQEAGFALQAGINIFLQLVPLVILIAILLWMRLTRHPSTVNVSTDAAEV